MLPADFAKYEYASLSFQQLLDEFFCDILAINSQPYTFCKAELLLHW